jgi:hypothetical protein
MKMKSGALVDVERGPPLSFDSCLTEIRKADESVRSNTRHLSELRRAYALDNGASDRLNT